MEHFSWELLPSVVKKLDNFRLTDIATATKLHYQTIHNVFSKKDKLLVASYETLRKVATHLSMDNVDTLVILIQQGFFKKTKLKVFIKDHKAKMEKQKANTFNKVSEFIGIDEQNRHNMPINNICPECNNPITDELGICHNCIIKEHKLNENN